MARDVLLQGSLQQEEGSSGTSEDIRLVEEGASTLPTISPDLRGAEGIAVEFREMREFELMDDGEEGAFGCPCMRGKCMQFCLFLAVCLFAGALVFSLIQNTLLTEQVLDLKANLKSLNLTMHHLHKKIVKTESIAAPDNLVAFFALPQCPDGWQLDHSVIGKIVIGGNDTAYATESSEIWDASYLTSLPVTHEEEDVEDGEDGVSSPPHHSKPPSPPNPIIQNSSHVLLLPCRRVTTLHNV